MSKSYSMDLRERIVEAYDNKEGLHQELAVRFKVSIPTIYRWLARRRDTGSIAPLPFAGGQRPAFDDELLQEFRTLALANNDAFEKELQALWNADEKHKPVSLSVIHRALVTLKLTRKKNNSRQRS